MTHLSFLVDSVLDLDVRLSLAQLMHFECALATQFIKRRGE